MLDKAVKSIVTAETLPMADICTFKLLQWTKQRRKKTDDGVVEGSKKNKNKNSINSPKIHFTFSHNL